MEYVSSGLGVALLGAIAGAMSASLGIGGGIVMVPAFIEFAGLDAHTAKGTSLFVIIFIAAANAWRLNRGLPEKPWRLAAVVATGSVFGGYFGGWVTGLMSEAAVLWVFVALLAGLGMRTFFLESRVVREEDVRSRTALAVTIGLITGVVGGMTGTGGGIVFVPLALLAGLVVNERVVGLSNMVMVVTSIAAAAAHLMADRLSDMPGTVGQVNLAMAPLLFLGAQIGSPWGKKLNDRLTLHRRRAVMGVLLLAIAARLIWRAIQG